MTTRMDGMSVASRWACLFALIVGPIVGCSDLDGEVGAGGSGGMGGTGGTGPTGGTGGTGGTDGCPTGTIYYEFLDPDGDPIEGVESCVTYADTTEEVCDTSNAEGKLQRERARADEEYTLSHEKEGYEGSLGGGLIGENGFGTSFCPSTIYSNWTLYPDDDLERQALAAQLETPYPWQGGIVALFVVSPNSGAGLGGVSFVPVGSTADQVGHAFYYDAATQQYSLDLEETTAVASPGALPLNQGGFVEVTPGVQEFEVIGAVGDCYGPGFGWPGDAPNRIRVPVRAGFRTGGNVQCDPP
jgi:hypothetical protein